MKVTTTSTNPRQIAFLILRDIEQRGAYADIALDRQLRQSCLDASHRGLVSELVYGCVRRRRTLDALIDQLATKPAQQQPPELRLILHLGLYQVRYLDRTPVAIAVDTTVQLAKDNGYKGLAGFVNGVLRQYLRTQPTLADASLGVRYSYPDWLIDAWVAHYGLAETEQLCEWFNQPPTLDLRINPLKTSLEAVEAAFQAENILVTRLPHLPQTLRLLGSVGSIQALPGFKQGWWTIQDASAQAVGLLLDPQPGEVVIDACAAPGGKTTHIAELMQDQGEIWGCDRYPSRLKKIQQNLDRLDLYSIQLLAADSRNLPQFQGKANRVLLDVPCSGLGTLHRHADARWRQTPEMIQAVIELQAELLEQAAQWVKPGGVLVYSTCTLNPDENQNQITRFLQDHPAWQIQPCKAFSDWTTEAGWVEIIPHHQQMDGFFMVRMYHYG